MTRTLHFFYFEFKDKKNLLEDRTSKTYNRAAHDPQVTTLTSLTWMFKLCSRRCKNSIWILRKHFSNVFGSFLRFYCTKFVPTFISFFGVIAELSEKGGRYISDLEIKIHIRGKIIHSVTYFSCKAKSDNGISVRERKFTKIMNKLCSN